MKLLLISVRSQRSTGGIAVWTEHFLSHCEKHGIDCHLINTEKVKRFSIAAVGECIRTRRIFKDLTQACRHNTFDMAHLNTSCGPLGLFRDYWIAKKLKKHGIPVVTHYHCDIPQWIDTPQRARTLQKLARISDANFVLCENSRVYLQQFGIDSIKVPNFVQENVITTQPKTIRDTLSRIFFVGRISAAKGAAEIYALAKRFPEKAFVLAGRLYPPVDTWIKPDNVLLLGSIPYDKVLATLDEADLFLFPSHSEGFSMALMEAMARGVPAIAVDTVGANGDMLADGCGVTVPLGDVDAMEQAIRDLEDPQVRASLSRNAIEKVKKHYTSDAVLALFKSQYETLI